jgi:SAM-dependent methyltransferase
MALYHTLASMGSLLRNWVLAFVAPRPLIGALYLPRYVRHWREYARKARGNAPRFADSHPCLCDWTSITPFDAHYFYQGGWLARQVAARRPQLHVDVGSSAQMIAVLSAMTSVVHIDYRPLRATLQGLECRAGDILNLPLEDASVNSLSCMHVLEHIGLGRYGDPLDPSGSEKAAAQLARVLAPQGRLYLSVPVGRERTCFNAHRVFDPATIERYFSTLRLESFAYVGDDGIYQQEGHREAIRGLEYGCGMFELSRQA